MLNEDLTEAAALGHDLGHTPFGHAGERALDKLYGGFKHYEQSLRVVDLLEKDGEGLNLTYEVRMAILNHTNGSPDDTCAKPSYSSLHKPRRRRCNPCRILGKDLPGCKDRESHSARINTITRPHRKQLRKNDLKMSPEIQNAVNIFREFMFEKVRRNSRRRAREEGDGILEAFNTILKSRQTAGGLQRLSERGLERTCLHYVAGRPIRYLQPDIHPDRMATR